MHRASALFQSPSAVFRQAGFLYPAAGKAGKAGKAGGAPPRTPPGEIISPDPPWPAGPPQGSRAEVFLRLAAVPQRFFLGGGIFFACLPPFLRHGRGAKGMPLCCLPAGKRAGRRKVCLASPRLTLSVSVSGRTRSRMPPVPRPCRETVSKEGSSRGEGMRYAFSVCCPLPAA